jgi:hypothetical protein
MVALGADLGDSWGQGGGRQSHVGRQSGEQHNNQG